MYSFPEDLDLSHLIGGEVIEISKVPYNLAIHLDPENLINISGAWRLTDQSGKIIDEGDEQQNKEYYKIHRLLGKKLTATIVLNPTTLEIIFDSEWKLEIFDEEEGESCHISPNIYI